MGYTFKIIREDDEGNQVSVSARVNDDAYDLFDHHVADRVFLDALVEKFMMESVRESQEDE